MRLWNSNEGGEEARDELEERLATYYGPRLREQPLPVDSWHQLHSQLGRNSRQQHRLFRWVFRRRSAWHSTPHYIEEAFDHIRYEAHMSHSSSILRCFFKNRLREVRVSASPFKRTITVTLPASAVTLFDHSALALLLATGLARYTSVTSLSYRLFYTLYSSFALLSMIGCVVFLLHRFSFWVGLLAAGLFCCSLLLLHMQQRTMAFAADKLVVLWLGRNATCQGLHALAGMSHNPACSHWGEPSLTLRIARVCGARVMSGDETLTLTRR